MYPDLIPCNFDSASTSLIMQSSTLFKQHAASHLLVSLLLRHCRHEANIDVFSLSPMMKQPHKSPHNNANMEMSSDPTDPPAREGNAPEQQAYGSQALKNTEEALMNLHEAFHTINVDQMLADFQEHMKSVVMTDLPPSDNVNPPGPPPARMVYPDHGFQAYLIQMQMYAGITRENLQPIQQSDPRPRHVMPASMLRLVDGEFRPVRLGTASFNGRLAPFFSNQTLPPDIFRDCNGLNQGIETDAVSFTPFAEEQNVLRALKAPDAGLIH